jgi:hypothetical protein
MSISSALGELDPSLVDLFGASELPGTFEEKAGVKVGWDIPGMALEKLLEERSSLGV